MRPYLEFIMLICLLYFMFTWWYDHHCCSWPPF